MNWIISRHSFLIIGFGLLLTLGIAMFSWQHLQFEYDRTLEEKSRDTMNLTKAFEEHIRTVLDDTDNDLTSIRNIYESSSEDPAFFLKYFTYLKRHYTFAVISVVDEHGRIVASTQQISQPINVSQREYFQFQRDSISDVLHIGKPVADPLTKENLIPVTRRIKKPDGSFGGLVFVGLRTDYFTNFYQVMDIGEDNLISVTGTDGIVRARQIRDNPASGQNVGGGELQRLARDQSSGTYISTSAIDGKQRIRSYRLLPDYPLIVSVGISTVTAFAKHEAYKRIYILLTAIAIVAIIGLCGLLIYFTERTARETRNLYQTLIGQSSDAIALYDPASQRFLEVNAQFINLTGYTAAELTRISLADLTAGSVFAPASSTLTAGDQTYVQFVCKDGRVVDVEPRQSVIMHKDKTIHLLSYRDVTSRKQAEEAVKKSEEQVRLLLNSTAEAIYGIDLQGRCTFANPSCLRMLGYDDDKELLGKNMHRLIHHSYLDGQHFPAKDCRIFQALHDREGTHVVDEVFWKADGSQIPVEYWSYPQLRNDEIIGAVVTFVDITERLHMQERIAELNRQIRDSLEEEVSKRTEELRTALSQLLEREKMASLGSLVSGIAHEINTPLGIGVTTASYLEQINNENRLKLTTGKMSRDGLLQFMENLDESITILNTNLYRAAELIKSFKQIAVNQSCELQVKFNLSEYIQAVLISLKHAYKNKNYIFEVDCPTSLLLYSYPGTFSQILTNLIMNSITHGFKGRAAGTVRIQAEATAHSVRLTYSDNGQGIPAANLSRIYDPFFTTNREHGGSGLGLNIVYNLVTTQLGGTIHCTSYPDQGTTFVIEWPLARKEETNEQQ